MPLLDKESHMPNYWLMKTEPSTYSYDDLEREGKTVWDGVSSNAALKNMRAMKKGDRVFIYHSGEEKAVIGIATLGSAAYADPKQNDPKLVVVEITPHKRLPKTVPLAEIKKQKTLADFALVRIPRLSVMPVTPAQWDLLMKLGGGS
jgi:predicted RNA-binding protein with PUA-like domain